MQRGLVATKWQSTKTKKTKTKELSSATNQLVPSDEGVPVMMCGRDEEPRLSAAVLENCKSLRMQQGYGHELLIVRNKRRGNVQ